MQLYIFNCYSGQKYFSWRIEAVVRPPMFCAKSVKIWRKLTCTLERWCLFFTLIRIRWLQNDQWLRNISDTELPNFNADVAINWIYSNYFVIRMKFQVCALRVTERARARILKSGGQILTFDQLALKSPKGENTLLIQGMRFTPTYVLLCSNILMNASPLIWIFCINSAILLFLILVPSNWW